MLSFWCDTASADEGRPIVAEALWIDSSSKRHVLSLSRYDGETWGDSIQVVESENPITSPAITTDSNGSKLVLWSEVKRGKSILMQSRKLASARDWSEPQVFSDFGSENLGASIIIDPNDVTWVFWSANKGELDDIYYVNNRKGSWSEPARAHLKNEVPDFRPQVSLSEEGDLLLHWQTYDFSTGQYIDAEQVFTLDKSDKSGYKPPLNRQNDVSVEEISLPSFFPGNRTSIIHFPGNKVSQSVLVE